MTTTDDRLNEIAEKLGHVQGQLEHMATKEDVAKLPTHEDLKKLATQADVDALRKNTRKTVFGGGAASGGVLSVLVNAVAQAIRGGG